MKLTISFLICFLFAGFVMSQDAGLLLQFNIARVDNHIQLDWTVSAGNTCNGISVYRSADSLNFVEIGDIQGICGSSDRNESYSFTDASPAKNSVNYYRLELGTLGYSWIKKLNFLDFSDAGFIVYPNPVNEHSKIYFLNPSRNVMSLKVFSAAGQCLMETEDSGMKNEFEISTEKLQQGNYFFTISSTADHAIKYKGQFAVF
jgi:hypothetical protein